MSLTTTNTLQRIGKGFAVAVIATFIGASLWILALSDTDYWNTIQNAYEQKKLGAILAAGALLNIPAFFIFIKQEKDLEARGLMLVVFIVAIFGMLQKFG